MLVGYFIVQISIADDAHRFVVLPVPSNRATSCAKRFFARPRMPMRHTSTLTSRHLRSRTIGTSLLKAWIQHI
ncbi:hypothetical protein GDO81_006226 [Engystomops pustulosus]|uniref:Uncharacterized protein n=1 Tax=Engystomops pustulosus TaxID=76066 RepID=A0AAV7CW02_ENGPU|nr:hypothetical protein GDO81_006226 [Engystomops pustulosus]